MLCLDLVMFLNLDFLVTDYTGTNFHFMRISCYNIDIFVGIF